MSGSKIASGAPAPIAGFGDFGGRCWLDTAHQGALPLSAAEASREAIGWKTHPHRLTAERFTAVPRQLRAALARVAGVANDEIVLANSASYGLHLLAAAYPWRRGDEIVVAAGDFPANLLPWLLAARRNDLRVKTVKIRRPLPTASELEAAISPNTRIACFSWIHSFSGFAADVTALGAVCEAKGVDLVINGSQAVGARTLCLPRTGAKALVGTGYKWLCGPYGTGFAWIAPELRARLLPTQAYWAAATPDALSSREAGVPRLADSGVGALDLFCTANFLNFVPWTVAVELILAIGIERIEAHNRALAARFIAGLDRSRFDLASPEAEDPAHSGLILFSARPPVDNALVHKRLSAAGIDIALRQGALRVSAHLYNGAADIDRLLEALARS